MIPSRK